MVKKTTFREKLLFACEGGDVHTYECDGQFFLTINQAALVDMMDPDDREGIDSVKELAFTSAAARDTYVKSRGW